MQMVHGTQAIANNLTAPELPISNRAFFREQGISPAFVAHHELANVEVLSAHEFDHIVEAWSLFVEAGVTDLAVYKLHVALRA
jgi:hypothetical protein